MHEKTSAFTGDKEIKNSRDSRNEVLNKYDTVCIYYMKKEELKTEIFHPPLHF